MIKDRTDKVTFKVSPQTLEMIVEAIEHTTATTIDDILEIAVTQYYRNLINKGILKHAKYFKDVMKHKPQTMPVGSDSNEEFCTISALDELYHYYHRA